MRYFSVIIARICHCEVKPKQSLFPFKNIMGRVWVIIIALFLFSPSLTFAETKEIISEGTYNMGDGETPSVAESRALLSAKRTALGYGIHFWVQIKAKVNPDKIEEMAKRVKEKSVVEDYKKIQEAYDKSQKEIEELKKQLAGAKGEKEKKQVEAKITDEERMFEAKEWFEKGDQHSLNKEHDSAIEAYTNAIALTPNLANPYNNRGNAYADKGQYDRAIEDFN